MQAGQGARTMAGRDAASSARAANTVPPLTSVPSASALRRVTRPGREQRDRQARRRSASHRLSWSSVALFCAAAVGVLRFHEPPRTLLAAPFSGALPTAEASRNAFGRSGEVRVRFALPHERVEYPIAVNGDPTTIAYQWVRLADAQPASTVRPLSDLVAPPAPGFYRLAIVQRDSTGELTGERHVLEEMSLAVMVPFAEKSGTSINGYRIGTYLAERLGARKSERPEGFVQVDAANLELQLTKHLRLGDFVTHDDQDTWPRYAALDARLLDKIELVAAEVARTRGMSAAARLDLAVHSGFRNPAHNRRVKGAAGDSRHQYGDAADVAIDANGDGRITYADSKLVATAVDAVERAHPDLVGGFGLYTRTRSQYVHIDARGRRARWRA